MFSILLIFYDHIMQILLRTWLRYCFRHGSDTASGMAQILLRTWLRYCFRHGSDTASGMAQILLQAWLRYCFRHGSDTASGMAFTQESMIKWLNRMLTSHLPKH